MDQTAKLKPPEIWCNGPFQWDGEFFHRYETTEWCAANLTLDVQDNGKLFLIATTGVVFTLPAVGATLGPYRFMNMGAAGAVEITISPDGSDMIYGPDITGTDDKDMVNTLATARKGDYLEIAYADGTGWTIVRKHGIWTQES
jgi:hypothetical protein